MPTCGRPAAPCARFAGSVRSGHTSGWYDGFQHGYLFFSHSSPWPILSAQMFVIGLRDSSVLPSWPSLTSLTSHSACTPISLGSRSIVLDSMQPSNALPVASRSSVPSDFVDHTIVLFAPAQSLLFVISSFPPGLTHGSK